MRLVELVYIPEGQRPVQVTCSFVPGMTVADVLMQSDIFKQYPETRGCSIGIFSKSVSYDTPLVPGDRVELYRPLISNPKEKRRQRASVRQTLLNHRR